MTFFWPYYLIFLFPYLWHLINAGRRCPIAQFSRDTEGAKWGNKVIIGYPSSRHSTFITPVTDHRLILFPSSLIVLSSSISSSMIADKEQTASILTSRISIIIFFFAFCGFRSILWWTKVDAMRKMIQETSRALNCFY